MKTLKWPHRKKIDEQLKNIVGSTNAEEERCDIQNIINITK
jgi:hypothetical protein